MEKAGTSLLSWRNHAFLVPSPFLCLGLRVRGTPPLLDGSLRHAMLSFRAPPLASCPKSASLFLAPQS